jgi:hypothetical protein
MLFSSFDSRPAPLAQDDKLKRADFAARALFLFLGFGIFVFVDAGDFLDGIIGWVGDSFLMIVNEALFFEGRCRLFIHLAH